MDNASAGGDKLIQEDAVLVQDYPDVIDQMEKVIIEMDQPPMQVVIEAMIMTVQLTDQFKFGVNFAVINDTAKSLLLNGNGAVLNGAVGFPPQGSSSGELVTPPGGAFLANTAGLKYGLIAGDITMFIDALERVTDTNLIASPQLRVINKQKAELIIGNRLGYTTVTNNGTTSIESANFLDVGTKLVLRPFITKDGMVRMEVHPERSSGAINTTTGLPDTKTTEVTTNIMVRDGSTVVIGGLIEEQIKETVERIPVLGALPLVGSAFQNKTERLDRTELIVLITPRIVRESQAVPEAETYKYENEQRRQHFKEELSPANRASLSRMHYERAEYYFSKNELSRAEFHAREAARIAKNDQPSIRLLHQIEMAQPLKEKKWWKFWKRQDSSPQIVSPEVIPVQEFETPVFPEPAGAPLPPAPGL